MKFTDEDLKEWVKISEHKFTNSKGDIIGKCAILRSYYPGDVVEMLNAAVSRYVGNDQYYEFIDINMDDPWTRVIISDMINGDTTDWQTMEGLLRERKIDKLLGE
jgi:hypothetical protein